MSKAGALTGKKLAEGIKRMRYTWSDLVPLIIVIIGLLMLLAAEKFPELNWIGIDWSRFLSNFGLYMAVVVALQWHYDKQTRRETIVSAVESALSNSNVVRAGIEDCVQGTKQIDYRSLLSHDEEVTIGFLHSSRFVDDNLAMLKERADSGKKTTIVLSDPNGAAIKYLLTLDPVKDHVIPSIEKTVARIDQQINRQSGVTERINVKHHDAVLRYSFVQSRDGVWVKMYRNSLGVMDTPGIYIGNGSPLYIFFDNDIKALKE